MGRRGLQVCDENRTGVSLDCGVSALTGTDRPLPSATSKASSVRDKQSHSLFFFFFFLLEF